VLGFAERRGSAAGSSGPAASANTGNSETAVSATQPEPAGNEMAAAEPVEQLVAGGGGGDAIAVNQVSAAQASTPAHLAHIASPTLEKAQSSMPAPMTSTASVLAQTGSAAIAPSIAPTAKRDLAPSKPEKTTGFVAPPPIEPKKSIGSRPSSPAVPDPFREADITNAGANGGANGSSSGKKPTLFERMTGTGRARREEPTTTEVRIERSTQSTKPTESSPADNTEPRLDSLARHSSPSKPVKSTNTVRSERVEEDPLEIPAFLRRQAN